MTESDIPLHFDHGENFVHLSSVRFMVFHTCGEHKFYIYFIAFNIFQDNIK